MDLAQVIFERVKSAGGKVVTVWAALLLVVWLTFYYLTPRALDPIEFIGATLFCGLVALGGTALVDRVRSARAVRTKGTTTRGRRR